MPDPDPLSIAMRSLADTSIRASPLLTPFTYIAMENPQVAFTWPVHSHAVIHVMRNWCLIVRWAQEDGMQNIIRAFGRTPPEFVDADTPFPTHQRMSSCTLNLTRVAPSPSPTIHSQKKGRRGSQRRFRELRARRAMYFGLRPARSWRNAKMTGSSTVCCD